MIQHLIVIDPQVDFCDPNGALYVKGADEDMKRLARFVDKYGSKLGDIHTTLDSHHLMHIAHPIMWVDSKGNPPNPFTIITLQDLEGGVWRTKIPTWMKQFPGASFGAMDYVRKLQENNKYPLCIWPPHCLIGSVGHSVYNPLYDSLLNWEKSQYACVNYITKGSNMFTEHYSAVKADVIDPKDHSTHINDDFIQTVMNDQTELVFLTGEAGSHCLANTGRDIIECFGDKSFVKKFVLLTDTTSPVPGFENLMENFINDMRPLGMQIAKTTDFI